MFMGDDPWSDVLPTRTAGYCRRCGHLRFIDPPLLWTVECCGVTCRPVTVKLEPFNGPHPSQLRRA